MSKSYRISTDLSVPDLF